MRTRHRGLATATAILALVVAVPSATAATTPRYVEGADEAALLFDPQQVVDIKMTMPQSSVDALWVDPKGEYMPGTIVVKTKTQTVGPLNVGIRLKGAWGSLRNLDQKAAFKIKVNYGAASAQRIFGLKKLTLNNMVQDPGMIHEAIAYRLFRNVGVAAPRVGYARVSLNGQLYGLYANVETPDSIMLPRWYPTTKHLYEGSYWMDVTPGREVDFEVDEGSSKDRTDLVALIAANTLDGDAWFDEVSKVANLAQMTTMWATEFYIGHWDGYAHTIKNNYYLHSDASGKFTMLPWGTDQTFDAQLDFTDTWDRGLMFQKCMGQWRCRLMYADALQRVVAKAKSLQLRSMADALIQTVRRDLALDPRKEADTFWAAAVQQRTKDFLLMRPSEVVAVYPQFAPTAPRVTSTRQAKTVTLSWQQPDVAPLTITGYAYSSSADGNTWSAPRKVNKATTVQVMLSARSTRYFRVQATNSLAIASEWSEPLLVGAFQP